MTGGFFADIERLAERAKDFDEYERRARQVADTLADALESTGKAWGSDVVGQSFDAAHSADAEQAMELLGGLGGDLGGIGTKFADAANTYRSAEEGGLDGIASAGRGLRDG